MIVLLIYWTALLPLFLGWGIWGHTAISTCFKQENYSGNIFRLLLLGIAIAGLLACIFSFIVPLGTDPYLLLLLYTIALAAIFLKRKIITEALHIPTPAAITVLLFAAVCIIVVIKSASPSEILDEKGYYLPFIKWVETYGITPGLANLQGRFGFNSAWHILSALLSLRWSGVVFYDLNGFIIFLVIGYNLFGVHKTMSPIRYTCGLFVSAFIFRNFLTSSAADLPNIYLTSITVLWMLDKYENKTLHEIDYTFIVSFIVSLFLVTIKPSSIYLLLMYLPTIVVVLFNKHFNKIIWLAGLSLLFIIPWSLRFYITTGYLVFPIAGIDLFNPDWKVPHHIVIDEYHVVRCFAISDTLPVHEVLNMSFSTWFPMWFKKLLTEQKLFFVAMIFITAYHIIRIKKYLHTLNDRLFIALQAVLALNCIIWLIQYPDFRFAWGFILVYVGTGICFVAESITLIRKHLQLLMLCFVFMMTFFNVFRTLKDVSGTYRTIIFQQAAFPEGSIEVEKINEVSYYKSDVDWDLPLPSILWWQHPVIALRDSTLKGGFAPVKE